MLFINNFEPTKEISMRELQSMKKKIDFYMDHYTLVKKNRDNSVSYEDKLNFLTNLNQALDTEINSRSIA